MKLKILSASVMIIALAACSGNKTKPTDDKTKNDSTVVAVNPRNEVDFEKFLSYFMNTAIYGKNFDSLTAISDSSVTQFIHPEIGFGRFWNMGAFCNLYKTAKNQEDPVGYGYIENNYGDQLQATGLKVFAKAPVEGFCEEAKSEDGIYYISVKEFPEAWDMEKDKSVKTTIGDKFASANKMKVMIVSEKYIVNQFYFVQIDNIWYLAFSDDCDCSV